MRILQCLAVFCLLQLPASLAAANADGPEGFVQNFTVEALDAAKSGGGDRAAGQAAFGALIADGFDLTQISDFVLGRYWQAASAAERAAFRSAFRDYLTLTYAGRVGSTPEARVSVVGSRQASASDWLVSSAVEGVGAQPYAVDWLVRHDGSRWRVLDLRVDGISMAATYRDQFVAVLRSSGGSIDALTGKLVQKNRLLAD